MSLTSVERWEPVNGRCVNHQCASGFEYSKQNFIMADHAKAGSDRFHRSPPPWLRPCYKTSIYKIHILPVHLATVSNFDSNILKYRGI